MVVKVVVMEVAMAVVMVEEMVAVALGVTGMAGAV